MCCSRINREDRSRQVYAGGDAAAHNDLIEKIDQTDPGFCVDEHPRSPDLLVIGLYAVAPQNAAVGADDDWLTMSERGADALRISIEDGAAALRRERIFVLTLSWIVAFILVCSQAPQSLAGPMLFGALSTAVAVAAALLIAEADRARAPARRCRRDANRRTVSTVEDARPKRVDAAVGRDAPPAHQPPL